MKKGIITILIITMLVSIGLVSCKNEVQAPDDYLVSVSFENDSSRALSATLESFDKGNYYWKYAAKKADSSNLLSGQTEGYDTSAEAREAGAQWVNEGSTGLGSGAGTAQDPYVAYRVQGFSQGLWNFTLFAYKNVSTTETPDYQLVYQGETTGVLITAGTTGSHSVNVVVSPVQSGNGTLSVLITSDNKITLNPATPLPEQVLANAKIQLGIDKLGTTTPTVIRELSFIDEDYSNNDLEPGTYKVSVQFTNDDATVVYASGSVVATVYSGLTTTVSGNLSEVVTYIEFDAEQNPDIVTTTIGTTNPIIENTGSSTDTISLTRKSDQDTTKVSASLSNETAQALITTLKKDLGADSANSSMLLNLSVDTTEATETTITYEIGMEAVLTYTKNTVSTTTTSTVKEVNDFVTILIDDMQVGLTDVAVTHSQRDMTSAQEWVDKATVSYELTLENFLDYAGTETDANPDGYYYYHQYDSNNDSVLDKAALYIKTKTFSPFQLSYTVPSYVAAIGSQTYYSLDAAVTAVQAGQTIQLLKDITFGEDHSVDIWEKAFNLDLNGHTFETKSGVDKDLSNLGYKASAVVYALEGKVAVKNGTIKTAYGAGIYAAGVELTVEDVVIKAAQTGVQPTDEYSSAVRLTSEASVIINSGSFEAVTAGGHAVAVSNSGGDVVINGGSFKSDLFFSDSTNTGVSKTITIKGGDFTNFKVNQGDVDKTAGGLNKGTLVITGGTFDNDPSAYVAEGYYAEHYSELGPISEYWIVKPIPEAPMAKVIRYLVDKDDADEVDYADIKRAAFENLELTSEIKKIIRVLPITNPSDLENYASLLAAIQTGTFVSFLPLFDAAGKTVDELPKSDAYYSGYNIVDIESWPEYLNAEFKGWRTDFRIITTDDFNNGDFCLVGHYVIGGSELGPLTISDISDLVNTKSMDVMKKLGGDYLVIPYDLLLGVCSTKNDVRHGFNCGAYATSPTAIGKKITVQLILTNDNLVDDPEKAEIKVCAEVVCEFHEAVIDNEDLLESISEQLDDSNQVLVTNDDDPGDYEYMSLATFRGNVNNPDYNGYYGYTATLQKDVDLEGSNSNQWVPIGNSGSTPFKGVFDGAGHTITGLYMNDPDEGEDYALFCYVENATIKNLTVQGIITAKDSAAGVVMKALGNTTVENVVNRVDVTAYNKVGGIICSAYPSYTYNPKGGLSSDRVIVVKNSINEGTLKCLGQSNDATHIIAGAIVAYAGQFGRVVCEDCTNKGVVKAISQYVEDVTGTGSAVASFAVGWCANNVTVADSDTNGCYITNCINVGSDNLVMVKKDMTETKRNDIVVGYASSCGVDKEENGKHYKYKAYVRVSASYEYTVIDSQTTVYIRNGQIYMTAD